VPLENLTGVNWGRIEALALRFTWVTPKKKTDFCKKSVFFFCKDVLFFVFKKFRKRTEVHGDSCGFYRDAVISFG